MAECLEIPDLFSNIYFLPEKFLMKLNIFFKRIYRHLIFMLMLVFLPGFLFFSLIHSLKMILSCDLQGIFIQRNDHFHRSMLFFLSRSSFVLFFFYTVSSFVISLWELSPSKPDHQDQKKSEKSCMAVSEFGQKSFTPADYLYVEKRK